MMTNRIKKNNLYEYELITSIINEDNENNHIDYPIRQTAKLFTNSIMDRTYEGSAVSLNDAGTILAIGAPNYGTGVTTPGAVYIYSRPTSYSQWTYEALLTTPNVSTFPQQGKSVSLNAMGNILAVGVPGYDRGDNTITGAIFIYSRSVFGAWTLNATLVGSTSSTNVTEGYSVSLNAAGDIVAFGGPLDNSGEGAVWIFTKSIYGVWTEEAKLVGTNAITPSQQGQSVSLNAAGNVCAIGAPADNNYIGATFIFIRSQIGIWTPQAKITVNDGVQPQFGLSTSLNDNGDMIIIGGTYATQAWIFNRSINGIWIKTLLNIPSNGPTSSNGIAVTTNNAGTIVAVGCSTDNTIYGPPNPPFPPVILGSIGATFIFVKANNDKNTWINKNKLVGTPYVGYPSEGYAVSLNGNGNILAIGAPNDNLNNINNNVGSTFIFQN